MVGHLSPYAEGERRQARQLRPDNVLTPLIGGAVADNYFMSVGATREDEAIATLAGAYMGGLRGVVMMQTSGFALIANALASLIVP